MSETTLDAVVRRVEQAPLADLLRVSMEEVQAQMDSYLDSRVDPASLCRRWERQRWAVQDVDFSVDVEHWASLDEGFRGVVRRIMTLFFMGEQAVTDTLAPILYGAPHEDERVFLATQIADEALHTMFFHRFFSEVLGVRGSLSTVLAEVGEASTESVRRIFDTHLFQAIDLVRREPGNMTAWAEAVTTYHVVIEGYLALTGHRNVLRFTRSTGFMPGFHTGFTAVARDESRHIGYGVLALRRRIQEQPELARVITLKLLDLADPTVATAVDPAFIIPSLDGSPPPEGQTAELGYAAFRDYAQEQLAKRLRAIGLSDAAIGEVLIAYHDRYARFWKTYNQP